jgi:hypothetical protein
LLYSGLLVFLSSLDASVITQNVQSTKMATHNDRPSWEDNYWNFPKLKEESVHLLWYESYYDGMLSAVCIYKKSICLVWMVDQADPDDYYDFKWYRRYALFPLSKDQIDKKFNDHWDLQRFVGTSCDYSHMNLTRQTHPLDRQQNYKFGNQNDIDIEILQKPPIGWYED